MAAGHTVHGRAVHEYSAGKTTGHGRMCHKNGGLKNGKVS